MRRTTPANGESELLAPSSSVKVNPPCGSAVTSRVTISPAWNPLTVGVVYPKPEPKTTGPASNAPALTAAAPADCFAGDHPPRRAIDAQAHELAVVAHGSGDVVVAHAADCQHVGVALPIKGPNDHMRGQDAVAAFVTPFAAPAATIVETRAMVAIDDDDFLGIPATVAGGRIGREAGGEGESRNRGDEKLFHLDTP